MKAKSKRFEDDEDTIGLEHTVKREFRSKSPISRTTSLRKQWTPLNTGKPQLRKNYMYADNY
jgi:hypothetical protein